MVKPIIIFVSTLIFTGCASFSTINDLSMVDFAQSVVTLNSSNVSPESNYSLTMSAFDSKKGKHRYVNLSKNVKIAEINNFATADYRVGAASIRIAGTSMAMLDTGAITLKIENALNGSAKEVTYPVRWVTSQRIVLPPTPSGAGAQTVIKVALLDTSSLPRPQGKLLYVKDMSTGSIYLHSIPVTVEARGKTGPAGARGADSYYYNAWGGAMDGQDGKDGGTGFVGGTLVIEGSKEAINYIKGDVTGGAGGPGGAGGRGAPGQVKTITFVEYSRYSSEIEKVFDQDGNEHSRSSTANTQSAIEEEFTRHGSSQTNTIKVRFKSGRTGRAGRTGLAGPSGSVTRVEGAVDREAFATNLALSKYLKMSDLN